MGGHAGERTPRELRSEMDASEMNDIIREQMGDIAKSDSRGDQRLVKGGTADDKAVEDFAKEAERTGREPEPRPTREEPPAREREVRVEREGTELPADDRLAKALETIETLTGRIQSLESSPRTTARAEPTIELEDIIPNVRLPKDRNMWPIKLGKEDVKKMGIDPEITDGLNVLANAFYQFVLDTIPGMAAGQVRTFLQGRDNASVAKQTFVSKFKDLEGHDDLVEMIETRQGGVWETWKHLPRPAYMDKLAEAARTRIATLRGQSYAEYMGNLGERRPTQGGSRATTTPVAGRGSRVRRTGQQAEMDDLIDNKGR